MKKRIIRAALMALAVITVLSVAFVFPSFAENNEEAEASILASDGSATEEVLASGSLPELAEAGDGSGDFPFPDIDFDSSDFWENWDKVGEWIEQMKLYVLSTGGSHYVNSTFNKAITKMHEVFLPLGYCIMFVCWIIGMCKCGVSLNFDPGAKDGIIWSGLSLLLGLFLMEVSMEIMESLSALCWEYCKSVYAHTGITTNLPKLIGSVSKDSGILGFLAEIGVDIIALIVEAVLLLNIAYMGLLQCFSPVFVGFAAGGDGTRRFATSFFKEYLRVCLVPPVLAVYVGLCFELFNASSVGVFLCLVLGISIFGIKNKIDKIIT